MAQKNELTRVQIENLKAATGRSEEEVLHSYAAMRGKFPSGGMSEEQFLDLIRDPSSGVKSKESDMAKLMFTVADRDKSGRVDLYEYLLTVALLCTDDPKTVLETLFIACDANNNDYLTQDEARAVFSTFFRLMGTSNSDPSDTDETYTNEKLDNLIQSIFKGKKQLSEAEFRHACLDNEDVEAITGELHFFLLVSLTSNAKHFEERRNSVFTPRYK